LFDLFIHVGLLICCSERQPTQQTEAPSPVVHRDVVYADIIGLSTPSPEPDLRGIGYMNMNGKDPATSNRELSDAVLYSEVRWYTRRFQWCAM